MDKTYHIDSLARKIFEVVHTGGKHYKHGKTGVILPFCIFLDSISKDVEFTVSQREEKEAVAVIETCIDLCRSFKASDSQGVSFKTNSESQGIEKAKNMLENNGHKPWAVLGNPKEIPTGSSKNHGLREFSSEFFSENKIFVIGEPSENIGVLAIGSEPIVGIDCTGKEIVSEKFGIGILDSSGVVRIELN